MARETKKIFSCLGETVYLLSEDRKYLVMQIFTRPPAMISRIEKLIGMRIPAISIPVKAGSLYRKVLQEGKPQLINDPKVIQGLMAEFTENKILKKLIPKIYSILDTRSVISIPFVSKGEALGLLEVSRKESFTEFDLKRLKTISEQLTSIIKRKQAEESLQKSEAVFKGIYSQAPVGIELYDLKGNLISVNQECLNIFGVRDVDEIKGFKLFEDPNVSAEAKNKLRNGELVDYQSEFDFEVVKKLKLYKTTRSGKCFLHLQITPYKISDRGNKGFVVHVQDITERKQAEKRLKETMNATIQTMSKIVEVKDPYTAGHQQRVSQLTTAIAKELNLSQDKIEGIRIASLIHDIGKISVPTEILSKSITLTDIEFSLLKEHSQIGYDILKSIDFSYPVAQIILQHHERSNGSGYPNSLKCDKILLEAKIIGIADVVEAISSHRPYRPALGIDKALEEISKNKGVLYDPEVVDICLKLFKEKGFKFN